MHYGIFFISFLLINFLNKIEPIQTLQIRSDKEVLDEYKTNKYKRQGDEIIAIKSATSRAGFEIARNWPNNEIPYLISPNLTQDYLQNIAGAIKHLHTYTCLTFRPVNTETEDYWIRFLAEEYDPNSYSSCYAVNFFLQIPDQAVVLSPICKAPAIVHELLHVAGFGHEHNRNDRDKYITIIWGNLTNESRGQFQRDEDYCLSLGPPDLDFCKTYDAGLKYNYESIMHYCDTCGSANNTDRVFTIVDGATDAIGDPAKAGQLHGLSEGDWLLINKRYGCDPETNPQIPKPPPIPTNPPKKQDLYSDLWKRTSVQPVYDGYNEILYPETSTTQNPLSCAIKKNCKIKFGIFY